MFLTHQKVITSDIIHSIVQTHPRGHLIKYFEQEENVGMYGNFMFALNQCHGKYIAICEGDDYWTDPLKLQKQVDFLEGNPEFEVCFTNFSIIDNEGNIKKNNFLPYNIKTSYSRQDLPIMAHTLTRVFRNRDFCGLPSAPGLDTIMLLWQSQYGKLKLINEVMGAYRLHDEGVYSSLNISKRIGHIIETNLICLPLLESWLLPKYLCLIFKRLLELHTKNYTLFIEYRKLVLDSIKSNSTIFKLSLKLKVYLILMLVSIPYVYRSDLFYRISKKIVNYSLID